MVFEFVGFFVFIGLGCWALYWGGGEMLNFLKFQLCPPYDGSDLVAALVLLIILAVGGLLLFYAYTHAPFTFTVDLKV